MQHIDTIILGAGIAGLGASFALYQKGKKSVVFEKDNTYGGLCGSFAIQGFRFDRFVHLSFSQNEHINAIFRKSSPDIYRHTPEAYNLYHGVWLKHPVQNNLYPLSDKEKALIINDFKARKSLDEFEVNNYEDWLRLQFGNYFAEHFPMVYTKKYWMKDACQLRTEWVGNRIHQPSIEEVVSGSKTSETPITYYAKEMRYPKSGGYKTFLKSMADVSDIRYKKKVTSINSKNNTVSFSDGTIVHYSNLISSLPLPEVLSMMDNVPQVIQNELKELECTSGYHISIALNTIKIPPYLWWYIYDEDILAARVYSPSMKSPDNAPEGCSSLQMEVYCKENEYSEKQLIDGTVGKLIGLGIINAKDILFTHIGFEKYANVIFTEPIYRARKIVREYLNSLGIKTIGRFGEWDYLWSDQSLLSGLSI